MSAKTTKYEKGLLKDVRESKSSKNKESRECANLNCYELGTRQPLENFYKRKDGKSDSYCIMCKKTLAAVRREHREFIPTEVKEPKMRKWAPKKTTLNLGKAPWCKDHRTNSKNCGCASGVFFKGKKQRAKLSESMKGKKNALGNHTKKGPMGLEHRLKISMQVRETLRKKKELGAEVIGK